MGHDFNTVNYGLGGDKNKMKYCSDCGSELVADSGTQDKPFLYCLKYDKTFWDKLERTKETEEWDPIPRDD